MIGCEVDHYSWAFGKVVVLGKMRSLQPVRSTLKLPGTLIGRLVLPSAVVTVKYTLYVLAAWSKSRASDGEKLNIGECIVVCIKGYGELPEYEYVLTIFVLVTDDISRKLTVKPVTFEPMALMGGI